MEQFRRDHSEESAEETIVGCAQDHGAQLVFILLLILTCISCSCCCTSFACTEGKEDLAILIGLLD